MVHATLKRNYKEDCTFGKITFYDGEVEIFSAVTLENPWKNNEVKVSCIPEGKYHVKKRYGYQSGSFDYTHFLVEGVKGRTYILFHIGNFVSDTLGCILVGTDFESDRSISGSESALDKMVTQFDEFNLTIKELV